MASLRWIVGFACLLSILAMAIADQQSEQYDSTNDQSESSIATALEAKPLMSPPNGSTHVVSFKLYEKSDSGTRVIGRPSVQTKSGQPFSVLAGTTSRDGNLEAGYSIQGTTGECVEGTLPLSLSIEIGESTDQHSTVQPAQSESLQFSLELTIPGSQVIKLSEGRECEIMVR